MNVPDHLFPQIHHRAPRSIEFQALEKAKQPFSAQEIDLIRGELLRGSGRTANCPRCGAPMEISEPSHCEETGGVLWKTRCEDCEQHAVVSAHPNSAPHTPHFENLIVSHPAHQNVGSSLSGTIMSMVLHLALIWAAVSVTSKVTEQLLENIADTSMVFLIEEQESEPEPEPEVNQDRIVTINLAPPPKGFQTLDAPIDMPTEIPPVDLSQRFDPRDYSGIGVEGGVFSGVVGGTGPVDLTQTFSEAIVDEIPERLSGPPLRYPPLLRQAGIEGVVVLEFVVDTTGRVDRESIRIVRSTNDAFNAPASNVVLRSTYRPGRIRGQAVKVLVSQRVEFSIARDIG
ncbi:MAG: TonB family protein [Gemmatimonadota bacterium]|nr:TonB family protein [Gemmatimonadota bacterium]